MLFLINWANLSLEIIILTQKLQFCEILKNWPNLKNLWNEHCPHPTTCPSCIVQWTKAQNCKEIYTGNFKTQEPKLSNWSTFDDTFECEPTYNNIILASLEHLILTTVRAFSLVHGTSFQYYTNLKWLLSIANYLPAINNYIYFVTFPLRGNCSPNQSWACFARYLKTINTYYWWK